MSKSKILIMISVFIVVAIATTVTVVFSQSDAPGATPVSETASVDFDTSILAKVQELAETGDEFLLPVTKDGSIILYSTDLEEKLKFKTPHKSEVHSIAVSPDKSLIVSGDKGGSVYVWNLKESSVKELKGAHKDDVKDISFSSDGSYFATASKDRTIKVWDSKSLAGVSVLKGHKSYVSSIDFSPDGKQLASVGVDNLLAVWDIKTGDKVAGKGNSHFRAVNQVKFSNDGKFLYTGSSDTLIKVWDAEKLECVNTLKGQVNEVLSLASCLAGNTIMSAGRDKALYFFDAKTGEKITRLALENNVYTSGMELTGDGTRIFTGDISGEITCVDINGKKLIKQIKSDPVTALCIF